MARRMANVRSRVDGKTGRITYEKRFTVDGRRYSVYGNTQKECAEKELLKREELKEHAYIRNRNVTLDQYFSEWIEQKSHSVTENTVRLFVYAYRHISPVLGKRKVKELERREVLKLQTAVYEKYSASTTNKVMNVLHQLLKSAEMDEIVTRNVCTSIPRVKVKKTETAARETTHRALRDEEISAFLTYARGTWYYNMFLLILATGMRAGECGALRWRDIDVKRRMLHVKRTVTKGADGKNKIGQTTKTKASMRDIPINDEIETVLKNQRKVYCELHGEQVQDIDALVFETEHHGIVGAANLTNAIEKIIKRANKSGTPLAYFGSHALRATFASKALKEDMRPNTLKELMGHSSYAMTCDLYGHVYEEEKKASMARLRIVV